MHTKCLTLTEPLLSSFSTFYIIYSQDVLSTSKLQGQQKNLSRLPTLLSQSLALMMTIISPWISLTFPISNQTTCPPLNPLMSIPSSMTGSRLMRMHCSIPQAWKVLQFAILCLIFVWSSRSNLARCFPKYLWQEC